MKLRNKKTGQIGNWVFVPGRDMCLVLKEPCDVLGCYSCRKAMDDEWEYYEEPKEYWYIDIDGEINSGDMEDDTVKDMRKIGNYFETKDEAERAVEKLKAWKRLKDKGFRFDEWDENHHNLGIIEFSISGVEKSVYDFGEDLDLLFGGEE